VGLRGAGVRAARRRGVVPPKWLNTATIALYRKSVHLYGLAEQADLLDMGTPPGRPPPSAPS